jgi:hypothetical protein
MYLIDIINVLINSYKYVDLRLVLVRKSVDYSSIAFLKFLFDNQNIAMKDTNFFNGVFPNLVFIQKILDIGEALDLIENLKKGIVELDGNSYEISSEAYFQQDHKISQLYNKDASDLYVRGFRFALLLLRPDGESYGRIIKSEDIPDRMKGFDVIRLIKSFLDTSGINLSNSRIVILIPIHCLLKDIQF